MSPYVVSEQDTTTRSAGVPQGRELVISTRHSEYHFFVRDSPSRAGLLSGGTLGDTPCRAFLLCDGEPKVGDRADFVVWISSAPTRLTTSRITAIRHASPHDHV